MNKAFEKLMAKKPDMPEGRMKARSSVLDELMDNMDDRESKKLGMKKVSVSSDSKEGLEQGLAKAKDMVGQSPEEALEESPEEEAHESPEMEEQEHAPTPEELMAEIEELKAKLAKLGV